MSSGIADPLRMVIFSCMNGEKANNNLRTDCKERGVVSALQLKNSASGAMELAKGKTGAVAGCLNSMSESIHTARETSKVFDGVCKGVNVVSDWVNPILVVASGVRVYNSEDKKSALLKEAGAMSAMFAAEGIYKELFGLSGKQATYKNYKFLNNLATGLKDFAANNKFLSKLPGGKLGGVIKALGFIATSCAAFEAGSRLGDAIAQRTTAKEYAAKHPEKHALANEPTNEDSTKEFVS
ncbi:MAG: hypothetical protein NC200_05385 [Candidatus Gastranaerophilales bacterium]|nr:hypothetical protein [Candidatus Gastranaerophilales bacterium]